MFFYNGWLITPLLLLVLLRIWWLYSSKTSLLVLISVVAMICRCSWIIYNGHRQTVERNVIQTLIVQPDMVKINGNLVTTVAKTNNGKKYLCNITVTKKTLLDELKKATGTIAINVKGTIQPISPATNENQFNPYKFYETQNIFNAFKGKAGSIKTVNDSKAAFLHVQRAKLIHYFQTFPRPCNYFCNRLLLGYSDIEMNETVKAVQKIGIIHLFCLSGLHVSVLCSIVRQILSIFNITMERINLIQIVILPAFWVIGGQSTSLTRAVIMLELGLFYRIGGIKTHDVWSLGLLIHTFMAPGILLNLGGQLSYLLSFALCRFKWTKIWRKTIDLNLVSLPVLLNTTYQVHYLTTFLNYIMIPFFSWVILPVTLLCAVIGPRIPLIMKVCNQGLIVYQKIVHCLSEIPGLIVFGKMPDWLCICLVICTLIWREGEFAPTLVRKTIILGYILGFLWIHFPIQGV